MVTQERLKELFEYDPESGLMTRLKKVGNQPKGKVITSTNAHGYVRVNIDGDNYKVHRLAFLYMEGAFPPDEVDHINRVRNDNRWVNLRHADASLNRENQKNRIATGVSGVTGVSWNKNRQKWQARIRVEGKPRHLGLFNSIEDATQAIKEAGNK